MTRLPSRKDTFDPRTERDAAPLGAETAQAFPTVAAQLVRRDRVGLMLGVSIALLLGAATLFGMTISRSGATRPAGTPAEAASAAASPLAVTVPMRPVPVPAIGSPPLAAAIQAPGQGTAAIVPPPMSVGVDAQRAPTLVFDTLAASAERAATPMADSSVPAVASPQAPTRQTLEGLNADEQFVRRIAGDSPTANASPMAAPDATVAQGTLIVAVLETAVNSDLPGYVRAVISRDVRSFDGRKVLIPRGSHVIGEYKSGLALGQTRAFVLWTRLLRPDGVSVALGSPATDTAGGNGLPGKVNSHFGKRFGAAILLSMISAGGQAIGGGGSVIIAAPSQAASTVAQRDIAIPPTVRVAAGSAIRIFVARDLDFSGFDNASPEPARPAGK